MFETYSEFKSEYENFFKLMMKYGGQAGAKIYAEKLAELDDSNPEWGERVLSEAV